MKILYIIRGHSGSGKTTLAHRLTNTVVEADNHMVDEKGIYRFDFHTLNEAHSKCVEQVELLMTGDVHSIAVSNTSTRKWEYQPYLNLAELHGYTVQEIICKGNFKNTHNVPEDVIQAQKERFEY